MKIVRVLNNNVVISLDENNYDIIVMGSGIAFNKKRGDTIEESKIERIFTQDVQNMTNKFKNLIESIPIDYMELTEKIINYSKLKLGKELADELYISLTDHIYFLIQRFRDGVVISNKLLFETKHLYKEEFKVASEVVQMINEEFDVVLPEDEIAFITLHFVNAELNGDMNNTMQITKVVNELLTIIRRFYKIEFDEDSLTYFRLLTHLKFFAQRMLSETQSETRGENQLFNVVKEKYSSSFTCVEKIYKFIYNNYKYELSQDEMLYLTIHIEKITN
ncbi:transcription antiterminator LicT [Clostridium puniceum]|uniref:Transcription antiterminator LicT n=1 Tax=Clostridium puniceum TaxID=29367 RepID=A0A1S8TBG6_9CLOT|nr:PRD domain-containing protein [Clostridium puniceum]OOM74951.1 transcription antiterminator LicT [Clostridium puniceum]